MSNHSAAHDGSRLLCDGLVREMALLRPGITRSEAHGTCGCRHASSSHFAYIYHRKKEPELRIYFRCPPDMPLKNVPPSISIIRSRKVSSGWAKSFPVFFSLTDLATLPSVARFLIDVAYPLSVPGASKPRSGEMIRLPEEVPSGSAYSEGSVQRILINRYERDPRAREECIRHYGTTCFLCGFDFVAVYGEVMAGFTHVHHLNLLSSVGPDYEVDPIKDLRPVCPNCHAVLHCREPPYSLDEVRALLQGRKG